MKAFFSLLEIGCCVNEPVRGSSSFLEYLMCKDFDERRCKSELIITTFQYGGKIFAEQASSLVHRSVVTKEVDMLKALLRSGDFGPTILKKNSKFCKLPIAPYYRDNWVDQNITNKFLWEFEGLISPLCIALMCGCYDIAQDFINMNYLTSSDLYELPKSRKLRRKLRMFEEFSDFSGIEILDKMEQFVPSLFQLAFICVSDSLSSKLDRHENITKLGLPPPLTKALLFQGKDQILTETNCESKDDVKDRMSKYFPNASIVENGRLFDMKFEWEFGASGFSDYSNSSVSGSDFTDYDSDNVYD